jgi:hypothetical protein
MNHEATSFRIGVMCGASEQIVDRFLAHNLPNLEPAGVSLQVVVLDEDLAGSGVSTGGSLTADLNRRWGQLWGRAKRQGRIAGCSSLTAALRILLYQVLTRRYRRDKLAGRRFPSDIRVVKVPTLNSAAAIEAVQSAGCDLVCLMGARILTRRTLDAMSASIVNIHSSDPRWVRGGPVVVWEVLAGHPALTLTVHEVTPAVDAGAILAERTQPVMYRGGLGATTQATMVAARPKVGDLFEQVIRDMAVGNAQRTSFTPGTLKVTPNLYQSLRAEMLCRWRSRPPHRIDGAAPSLPEADQF